MASDPRISGFDGASVRSALRLAMQVGLPTNDADLPTFYMPTSVGSTTEPVDTQGRPFDPTYKAPRSTPPSVRVPCAIEYKDAAGHEEVPGSIAASRVVLTLLDEDYQQVKGFAFVVIGGDKYFYRHTETPLGMVSVGVYRVHCVSEDQP